MTLRSLAFVLCVGALCPPFVFAQATLENPAPDSFQSGLGVISGWACAAQAIEIVFNDGPPQQAAYGTSRGDTQTTCGDTDNGFGLLFNWNLLGDGVHTVQALADGVEFARVTVTVTTFGTEFLREASGTVLLTDFPTPGRTLTLRWQPAQQNFAITDGSAGRGGGTSGAPPHVLEIPVPGSFQSGLGVISGWVCEAQRIAITFDDGPPQEAAYGTSRGDTQGACGDTDNGFGLLFNWNLLGDGPHTVAASADEVEFARVAVTVTTLGKEIQRGLSHAVTVPDFPTVGTETVLQWSEAQQNFVIIQTTSPPVCAHFLPDANLCRAIVDALGKPPGAPVTKAELATLRELDASDQGIVDLTGLEFATNLTELRLSDTAITDLTPLAGLTSLTWLSIDDTAITDLTPLTGLPNLRFISIGGTAITDLTPLAGLTRLVALNLPGVPIVDLSPLAGLPNLSTLYLSGTGIRDLSPLAGLPNLVLLSIGDTAITDLTPLADLPNLEYLYLDNTGIRDLTPLFGLPKLAVLDITGAPVLQKDLDTLAQAGVAIDGSPLFIGSVDIHHDNVIVMHLPELPVTRREVATRAYTRRIYEEFEDAFDYLVFVHNFDDVPGDLPYGLYTPGRNDTQGIGRGLQYGSQRQLFGMIALFDRSAIRHGPSLHELMHRWANYVVPTSYESHWGFSSAYGQLGGFPLHDLVHLGGNRYTVQSVFGAQGFAGNYVPYSPIELYLAGFIPPEEVPDLWVAEDGEWLVENGERVRSDEGWPIFTATTIRTISIDDIIAEHGKRVPDWTVSQKDFQAAAILLVDDARPATPAQIQEVSDHVAWFSHPGNDDSSLYNFYEATGGRATITMDGLSQFLKDG